MRVRVFAGDPRSPVREFTGALVRGSGVSCFALACRRSVELGCRVCRGWGGVDAPGCPVGRGGCIFDRSLTLFGRTAVPFWGQIA